jgi:serine/threonine protein kinase
MMYQCATGILPFVGKDPFETMYKHIYEKAHPFDKIRPDVQYPAELERIIFRCLEIDLSKRYGTVDELLIDLERLRGQNPEVMQISPPSGQKPRAQAQASQQAITQIEISAPGLLRQAGILAPQDLDTIAKLTAEVGGDTASILLATGKLEPAMLDAANTCKKWIELGKMNISQAIILLNYCFRARSNFNEAMTELGWTLPGVS